MAEEDKKESNVKASEDLKASFGRQEQKIAQMESDAIEVDLFKQKVESDIAALNSKLEEVNAAITEAYSALSAIQSMSEENEKNVDSIKEAARNTVGGKGVTVEVGSDGSLQIVSTRFDEPFDLGLIDMTNKTLSVLNNQALNGGYWLAGVMITSITDGTGMSAVGGPPATHWISGAFSAGAKNESWIYLMINKTTGATTINMGTTAPVGSSSEEPWPLYYIPWDSTTANMNIGKIVDLRDAIHVPGFA